MGVLSLRCMVGSYRVAPRRKWQVTGILVSCVCFAGTYVSLKRLSVSSPSSPSPSAVKQRSETPEYVLHGAPLREWSRDPCLSKRPLPEHFAEEAIDLVRYGASPLVPVCAHGEPPLAPMCINWGYALEMKLNDRQCHILYSSKSEEPTWPPP